ncbi:MAG: transcription termination factor Rho [Eubacteriales bacterium]|nr:transcription termination factor Rho [Eubacteriales bacterium]
MTSELQGMTVVDLRQLARANGVKLNAGIDKAGIVQRLQQALDTTDEEAGTAKGTSSQTSAPTQATVDREGKTELLQAAPLAADVTSVQPGRPQPWNGNAEGTPPQSGDYRPAYRQALQSKPNMTLKQPLRQPVWQQTHQTDNSARFGPRVSFDPLRPVSKPEEDVRFSASQAPVQQAPVPQAPAQHQPLFPQQTLDGYRLGYRAAPTREYGRQEYRNNYRSQPRTDYPRPTYGSYPQSGYQQPPYASLRASENYYNDSLYKPTRDPAFVEPYEPGHALPDALQAAEGTSASGILEILPDGYGFLRSRSLLPGKEDIYVSVATIRRYELRTGDLVEGKARQQRDTDKFAALLFTERINGQPAAESEQRLAFENLVPIYPSRRIVLESEKDSHNWPMRIVNLIAPIGFGQRAMIVAPPETGKSILLRELCKAIKQNDEIAHVMMLLIDERPEAVTEIRDAVGEDAEVFASTFDTAPENQTRVSETMLERAERLVERGQNVVILLDSLTKLTRAYQATLTQGGRAMTNTVTPAALVRPKRFFGAARNTRDGGSLTVIATILVETGSRVDDIIFEEFKGTANMELWLDVPEGNEPMFPVIDMQRSGTKKEDMLLNEQEIEGLKAIRTVLGSTTNREALSQLIGMMAKTKDNADLFNRLKDWVAMWEKSGFLVRK